MIFGKSIGLKFLAAHVAGMRAFFLFAVIGSWHKSLKIILLYNTCREMRWRMDDRPYRQVVHLRICQTMVVRLVEIVAIRVLVAVQDLMENVEDACK